jgi:hypothetical protein
MRLDSVPFSESKVLRILYTARKNLIDLHPSKDQICEWNDMLEDLISPCGRNDPLNDWVENTLLPSTVRSLKITPCSLAVLVPRNTTSTLA